MKGWERGENGTRIGKFMIWRDEIQRKGEKNSSTRRNLNAK